MTIPTTNYSWPKPENTEPADIAGVNAVTDAIESSITTVAQSIGAIIKPAGMMKLVAQSVYNSNTVTKYLTSTGWWEPMWFVEGTVDGSPSGTQPIVMDTYGTWKVTAPGLYRLTYHFNFLCYATPTEAVWMCNAVRDDNLQLVPRTRSVVRMQTHFNSFQTMHCSTLLRADIAASGYELTTDVLYKFGTYYDGSSVVGLTTRYDQADLFYSYYSLEYVRGL